MTEPYEKVEIKKRHIIINNFLGGIAWGLGATIGLAIVLAIIGFIMSKIGFIPVIGKLISDGFEQALKNSPRFR